MFREGETLSARNGAATQITLISYFAEGSTPCKDSRLSQTVPLQGAGRRFPPVSPSDSQFLGRRKVDRVAQYDRIRQALRRAGEDGLTRQELAGKCGIALSSACARVRELYLKGEISHLAELRLNPLTGVHNTVVVLR